MVVEIGFTAQDLALTRFAVSPLWEVVASVRVLKGADTQGLHRHWAAQAGPALAAAKLDLAPLFDLVPVPTPGIVGFLAPPPAAPQPSLQVELAALRATPVELIRTTDPMVHGPVEALREDPVCGLGRLADTITAYWDVALAPYWPRILALHERDIQHRAQHFAEGGAHRLLVDLNPQLAWGQSTLRAPHGRLRGPQQLGGRGLLLLPSAFTWPRIFSILESDHYQPTLRYPPLGIGTLWQERPRPQCEALAGVLGRTRARLLAELTAPASTTDLARRIDVTPGGTSQHLTALRTAGLVRAHRMGRVVLYARTSVGEALVHGAG
ncbi:winged helix-turn-helix domain-containing protein [Streptomyces sp. G-G2]|uniref:ArsR/SmtB family transcription factor n=1 Tax=Streptomyces sp. G-G2 TaxID=3046201 RepID=UPI0024BB962A|nr:winged helix-turn-helix domain-containing protein [Streptomyces sp. G-G2]MDJ0386331.1 winged helix-turn-helix domain-containing protein [Streptomyces sp. G-G2]